MDLTAKQSSPCLQINLLGGFSVYINGQTLPDSAIKGRKARQLFKLIAHQRQYQMVRDHVIEILWPELDVNAALSQLYKAIHHIRKGLGTLDEEAENWIIITEDIIRIAPPGGVIIDAERFGIAARTGLKGGEIADLEMAVSIYRGDFLPMDLYEEWAAGSREHYRQLFLDVLTTLAWKYEQEGDLSEAAEMLRLALEKEPTLETAHCGLMRIFAKKGQVTRAFHQYDVCREVLRDELGMSPSPETKTTLNNVQEGKYQMEDEIHVQRPMISGPSKTIIGRSEECAVIAQQLENLYHQQGGGLVISGEAGIGKTRLVKELLQQARQKELPFFVGNTNPGTGNMAYESFIELFGEILNKHPDLGSMLPVELGSLIPGWSGEGHPLPYADQLAAKGYLFAQVHRFFSRLTSEVPAVIIMEDFHVADQGSKELLSYMLRHRGNLPVLFVVTWRKEKNDSLPPFIMELKDQNLETVDLSPFSYEEHVTLLQQYSNNATLTANTTGYIYHLAEGNPWYTLELLRHYTENDHSIPSQPNEDAAFMSPSPVSGNLPDSIFQMVEQKLEDLSPATRHLLYMAAVIGRQVPYELVASIWTGGNTETEYSLFNALEEAIRAGLLIEHGLDYTFRHALVQETLYTSIAEPRRQILHKQVANRLLELSPDKEESPAALVAWHFLGANEMEEGAKYLLEAGKQAEKVYAHEDALQHYGQACEVLKKVKDDHAIRLKCEILERIGDVYRACGQIEKCYDAYEEAISHAENLSMNNPEQAELHRKVAVAAIFRTEMDRSEKYLQKAFALAGDDPRSQARLYITKALHLWHFNRLEEAYELAQQALSQARKINANAEASQACEILAMTCLPLGRWEEGLHYEMEREIFGWSPEIVVATDAHLCLWEYHVAGDQPLQQARTFLEKVSDQASQVGNLRCVAVCHYALGTMYLWRGNRRHAVEELSSSLELHERVGSPAGMAYSLARKGVLHTLMGAKELGWQAVRDGLVYGGQASVRDHCLQRLYGVGIWNRLEAGNAEQAGQLVTDSEALLAETGACAACALDLYPWLAYYYLQNGALEKAQACGKAVSELAEKTENPVGKAIAAMIQSSLCITEMKREKAADYSRESYQFLEETVPDTTYSPVAHYLKKMEALQGELV